MKIQSNSALRTAAIIMLVIGAGFIVFRIFRSNSPDVVLQEFDLAELTNQNDRLYVIGQTNTFTGIMTEHYPGGSVKSKSEMADGQMHGKSEGFFQNGQKQIEEYFKLGVSDGIRTRWNTNGIKESEGRIVRGAFDGEYRTWHTNGQTAEQIFFEKGKPHGVAKSWYPSGFLKSRVEMELGETKQRETWNDGEKRDEDIVRP